jgi:proline dehydrogenase
MPRFGFVRRAVKRFMPGEEVHDALAAARDLREKGIATIVTHLGENLTQESEANSVTEHYLEVLTLIAKEGLDCHISVKLTQLGLDLNDESCHRRLVTLAARARELENHVWIDMESSPYVDRTIGIFSRLRSEYSNTGLCVQSYLYRTAKDLGALLSLKPSIRLVKGAYAEPKNVAYRSKRDVDENYFHLARELLLAGRLNGVRLGIGTHDQGLIDRIRRFAVQEHLSKESFEIQMLYGVRSDAQLRLANEGYRVRTLISYGSFWFPWYMRRLAERPANVWFVVRNLLAGQNASRGRKRPSAGDSTFHS